MTGCGINSAPSGRVGATHRNFMLTILPYLWEMSNYQRWRHPGGTYFFTVNAARRGTTILTDHIDHLRTSYVDVAADLPFRTEVPLVP